MSPFFRVAPFTAQIFINTLLFIGALAFFTVRLILDLSAGRPPETFDVGASVALAIIVAYAWLRSVKGYRLEQGELVVERTGPGRLRIDLGSIQSAEARSDRILIRRRAGVSPTSIAPASTVPPDHSAMSDAARSPAGPTPSGSIIRLSKVKGNVPYFLASGVTVIFMRWPSRITTMSTARPILAASSA